MKLFWGPHTCAIGIHILLEEIGRPYETEKIDVSGGATHQPQFLAINPKGKVPTLVRDDGSVLTEFGAIATWLARTHPETNLLPSDSDIEARVAETIAYVEGTIHGQGYARLFKPAAFAPDDLLHAKLGLGRSSAKRQGRKLLRMASRYLTRNCAAIPMRWVMLSRLRISPCFTSSAGPLPKESSYPSTSPRTSSACLPGHRSKRCKIFGASGEA